MPAPVPKFPYNSEPEAAMSVGAFGVTWLQVVPSHFQMPAPAKDRIQRRFCHLQHKDIIAAAIGLKGVCIAVTLPGGSAISRHINIAAAVYSYAIAEIIVAIGSVKCVPLIGSVSVKLQNKDVIAPAIGMNWVCIAVTLPGGSAISRHIHIVAAYCYAKGEIITASRAIKCVPLICPASAKLQHKDVIDAAMSVERVCTAVTLPGGSAISRHIHIAAAVYSYAIALIIAASRAVKCVPLIGPVSVKLQHKDVIAAAIGMNWVCIVVTLP